MILRIIYLNSFALGKNIAQAKAWLFKRYSKIALSRSGLLILNVAVQTTMEPNALVAQEVDEHDNLSMILTAELHF